MFGYALAPVVLIKDQTAAGGVGHYLTIDAIEAGVANQLALLLPHHMDTPAHGGGIATALVEPLVLILQDRCDGSAEVLGDLEFLHAAALNETRHVLALDWCHLNEEVTYLEAHDWSEHDFSFQVRAFHIDQDFRLMSRSNDRMNLLI